MLKEINEKISCFLGSENKIGVWIECSNVWNFNYYFVPRNEERFMGNASSRDDYLVGYIKNEDQEGVGDILHRLKLKD